MTQPRARLAALTLATLLGACGGGGTSSSNSASADVSSRSTAQSVTASGAALPADSTEAVGVAVSTARVAITGTCAGGGSATVSVSGGTFASRSNAVFDAGEVFDITFAQCQSASGAAAVTGRMTLTVVGTVPSLVVDTASTNLSVALPLRTVTLNGSSTLTQTIAGSDANATTTNRWTAGDIRIESTRGSDTRRYALRNVDYTRTIVAVNGVPVSGSGEGHSTLEAQLLFLPWFITLATLGPVSHGPTGVVLAGRWSIDTPDDHLELEITPLSVSLRVDLGNDGDDDLVFFFSVDSFFDAAG